MINETAQGKAFPRYSTYGAEGFWYAPYGFAILDYASGGYQKPSAAMRTLAGRSFPWPRSDWLYSQKRLPFLFYAPAIFSERFNYLFYFFIFQFILAFGFFINQRFNHLFSVPKFTG